MDAAPSAHPTRQVLNSFGLGKLARPFADAVSKHLEWCDPCRNEVAGMFADSFVGRARDAQAQIKSPSDRTEFDWVNTPIEAVGMDPSWDSLIEFEGTESLIEPARAVAKAQRQISPWTLGALAAGSIFGILAMVVVISVATNNRRMKMDVDGLARSETVQRDFPSTKAIARGSASHPDVRDSQPGNHQGWRDSRLDFAN